MTAGVTATTNATPKATVLAAADAADLMVFFMIFLLGKGVCAVSADLALTVSLFERMAEKSK